MARTKGSKNRNYPALKLEEALRVARVLEDKASGMIVSNLTLAELLGISPSSSVFGNLVSSSRMYGLTTGGVRSQEFGLTEWGEKVTGADEVRRAVALKQAVLSVEPYRLFFEQFQGKKFPATVAAREFLITTASVPRERVEECLSSIRADAATAGLVRTVSGGDWVDLEGVPKPEANGPTPDGASSDSEEDSGNATIDESAEAGGAVAPGSEGAGDAGHKPTHGVGRKVFIAHGSNRVPLEQLKKALDQFKVPYAVAVDEPNKGRPISKKVSQLMQDECSSGIFIFTADERFLQEVEDEKTKEKATEVVWRPRENVIYELGAASILYENRIVIFKETDVSFPSDFSDLGYIEFEKDQLVAEIGSLFSELVALDVLEVRAKG